MKTVKGPVTLHTKGAQAQAIDIGWRDRFLALITDPNVAYILMMLGMLGLFFELVEPRRDPARRDRRHLADPRVLRLPEPADQLGRAAPDPVRDRAPDRRDQDREPRRADHRRDHRDPARLGDAGQHARAPAPRFLDGHRPGGRADRGHLRLRDRGRGCGPRCSARRRARRGSSTRPAWPRRRSTPRVRCWSTASCGPRWPRAPASPPESGCASFDVEGLRLRVERASGQTA